MKLLHAFDAGQCWRRDLGYLEKRRVRNPSRAAFLALAVAVLTVTSGCALMPAAAPTALEIEKTKSNPVNQIAVFDIDADVITALKGGRNEGFAGRFSSKAPAADLRIAVGDTLQISVIEQSVGLPARPGEPATSSTQGGGIGATAFLPVTVGANGMINVPFAGSLRAVGLTVETLRAEIEHKLADKAVNPQVQLALSSGGMVGANSATVGGEVSRAGIVPLRPSGSRLLDVIAEAGGAHFPAFETTVHLTRKDKEASASLQRIVNLPAENIFVYPGDNIYVSHDPRTYTVLGASTKVGRYPFGSERLNLAEAVAEAGGFVDAASDPSGVFLFRYEAPSLVRTLGADVPSFDDNGVAVIYKLNLREGDGYFRARQFEMRDKDIVLLANSDGAQLLKFVTLLQGVSTIASNFASTALVIKTIGSNSATVISTTPAASTSSAVQ